MESVYREVKRRCHAEKRVTPSRNSVLKRIRALDARLVARKRLAAPATDTSWDMFGMPKTILVDNGDAVALH
jgi:hypothetical protein